MADQGHDGNPVEQRPLRTRMLHGLAGRPELAERFYERLFELQPGARALFPTDLAAQQQKFRHTLQTVLAMVDAAVLQGEPADSAFPRGVNSELERQLAQMGLRHQAYGALPVHYAAVGEALLHALDQVETQPLDATERAAWIRLYAWISARMLDSEAGLR